MLALLQQELCFCCWCLPSSPRVVQGEMVVMCSEVEQVFVRASGVGLVGPPYGMLLTSIRLGRSCRQLIARIMHRSQLCYHHVHYHVPVSGSGSVG
jgi:hypothetical protein